MLILGIETSCDETGASVIEAYSSSTKVKLLSNVVATSLSVHSKTGGIVPETAAREQIRFIIPVIKEAIEKAQTKPQDVDIIAVTIGPGLIGSLLVGLETAKTLSFIWNKPLIPVNHLIGHIYANFTELNANIDFPAIGLIVSGGHTDLVLIKDHGNIKWLGGTRDDAAGEAFDKIGRLLNLPYPGGPYIEEAAKRGDLKRFKFPSPLIDSDDFDFSFSGLKTAVFHKTAAIEQLNNRTIADLSASVQKAIVDVLVKKTLKAAQDFGAKSVLLGGGVAANQTLRDELQSSIINNQLSIKLFIPEKWLCTDNAAMIATAAFFNKKQKNWQKIDANPGLYF